MRNDTQDLTFQFAPATSILLSKLKEVDGTLKLVIPWFGLNFCVLIVNLDESARTNHRIKRVVIHPDESIEIFPKAEVLNEGDRYFAPSLHHAGEEIGVFNPRSRIEPHGTTHTTFPVISLGPNTLTLCKPATSPTSVALSQ